MIFKNKLTGEKGFFAGTPDFNWQELTQSEIEAYELEEAKTAKISQLKTNKDNALNGFVLITINSYPFNIYKDQLEVLAARIYYLTSNNLTSSNWTDNNNFRRELTLEQFEELYSRARNHYTVMDDNAYTLYIELKNEIDAISIDGEYFNENQEPISALQALENININFE
jgi:hypothetical protein